MLPHPFTKTLLESESVSSNLYRKGRGEEWGMLRWAAIASLRAATRLAVASSRPLIVHPTMAPVGATTTIVSTRPLLLSSIARLPSDFSATRGYARGRSKPISSEEEDEDEDLVDDDDDEDDDDEDFDHAEDFDDEDDSDDGEYERSDRY